MRFWSLVCFVCFSLSACVSTTSSPTPVGGTFSSVQAPGLVFPAGTAFSWSRTMQFLSDDPRLDGEALDAMLRESIEDALTARGYRIVDGATSYSVGFVAALEGALSDADIDRHFGINPGLPSQGPKGPSYEKGTVIIDVSDVDAHKSLWRSAMQGYVNLDLPASERKERIKRVVSMMFNSFPRGQ